MIVKLPRFFNTELVEVIIAEEKKGGKAAQPFRDFENYVEDLRKNFTMVAGAWPHWLSNGWNKSWKGADNGIS